MTNTTDIERLNYYEGEYLGALDFAAEQDYHREMRRRHNVGQHTWGIIAGLDIVQIPNGAAASSSQTAVDIYIQPGMAVDAFGREIVVFNAAQLTEDLFTPYYDPNANAKSKIMYVWIKYQQQFLQPSTDLCATQSTANPFGRVQEGYQLIITPTATPTPDPNDPIVVDGASLTPPPEPSGPPPALSPPTPSAAPASIVLPYDGSVPYQEFATDDTTVTWLIPLGQVLWDPHNGTLLLTPGAAPSTGRLYAGNVSAAIYAPAGSLIIQDRFSPLPLPVDPTDQHYSGVKVEVAGTLTVDRLITAMQGEWIFEPFNLSFKDDAGTDGDQTALWIGRNSNASGGADLHIHIGDNSDAQHRPQRLTIGYGPPDGSGDTNVMDVRADGNVDILQGALGFGAGNAQVLNLSGTNYGIGVQPATLFFRSPSDFAWYIGGTYKANQDDPGGGTLAMLLDKNSRLTISGDAIVDGNTGIGTSSPDTQLHVSGGAWDLTNSNGDLKIGNAAYCLKFGVALGGAGAGDGRIRAMGGTNRLMIGAGLVDTLTIVNGNVGIDNTSPSVTLDVNGPIQANGNLTVKGNRTYLLGLNSTQVHWIMGGGTRETGGFIAGFNALGFDPNAFQVSIGSGWDLKVNGNLDVVGNINATGSKAGYVAEHFINRGDQPVERGDVVVVHSNPSSHHYGSDGRIPLVEVQLTDTSKDTRVCGIVDEVNVDKNRLHGLDLTTFGDVEVGLMVTLGAYAYCKVDADVAPIAPGDLLVTSSTKGYARKLDAGKKGQPGAIIGKALGGLTSGKGLIPVFVSHQ